MCMSTRDSAPSLHTDYCMNGILIVFIVLHMCIQGEVRTVWFISQCPRFDDAAVGVPDIHIFTVGVPGEADFTGGFDGGRRDGFDFARASNFETCSGKAGLGYIHLSPL